MNPSKMSNALAAMQVIQSLARGYLHRLVFQRIHFCVTELLRIPRIACIIDPHATEDVHLVLKLQGPEFPPRVVYAFTSNREYCSILLHPNRVPQMVFHTSGASSRYHGEEAMTRSFVQRVHTSIKYKELFSYDRQLRRYVTVLAVTEDSASHTLLEQALLRCNRKLVSPRTLPPAKAMRARQLRMMFGLSRVSESSSRDLQQSTIIRAPHQSEHVYDMIDASLLEFCNQTGVAPTHWSAVSTPDVHFELDASPRLHQTSETSSPPIVDIDRRKITQESQSQESSGATTFRHLDSAGMGASVQHLGGRTLPLSNVFLTEEIEASIRSALSGKSPDQSDTQYAKAESTVVHFVRTDMLEADRTTDYASQILLNCTPMQPLLQLDPHSPDDIIDEYFNTETKNEVRTILDEIGSLSTHDITL